MDKEAADKFLGVKFNCRSQQGESWDSEIESKEDDLAHQGYKRQKKCKGKESNSTARNNKEAIWLHAELFFL